MEIAETERAPQVSELASITEVVERTACRPLVVPWLIEAYGIPMWHVQGRYRISRADAERLVAIIDTISARMRAREAKIPRSGRPRSTPEEWEAQRRREQLLRQAKAARAAARAERMKEERALMKQLRAERRREEREAAKARKRQAAEEEKAAREAERLERLRKLAEDKKARELALLEAAKAISGS